MGGEKPHPRSQHAKLPSNKLPLLKTSFLSLLKFLVDSVLRQCKIQEMFYCGINVLNLPVKRKFKSSPGWCEPGFVAYFGLQLLPFSFKETRILYLMNKKRSRSSWSI